MIEPHINGWGEYALTVAYMLLVFEFTNWLWRHLRVSVRWERHPEKKP